MSDQHEREDFAKAALEDAMRQLHLHYLLAGLDAEEPLSWFATLMFAKPTEDDADPFNALGKVMQLLLDDRMPVEEPEYDVIGVVISTSHMSKAKLLTRAVNALEAVVSRQFQRTPTIGEALANLNEAAVRPEDVQRTAGLEHKLV